MEDHLSGHFIKQKTCLIKREGDCESIGVTRLALPFPFSLRAPRCHEIVPNCPQIDSHPRFPEPLNTATPEAAIERERGERSGSASPLGGHDGEGSGSPGTPRRIWIQLHLIVLRCL